MPRDYDIVDAETVAKDYYDLGLQCDKVIKYELDKYGLEAPEQFLGDSIPNLAPIKLWIKRRPTLAKIADYEHKHHVVVKKPSNIEALPWKMFTQFIISEPYLKSKQGCLLTYQSAKHSRGLAIWADVTHGNPFDLWRINPSLVQKWQDSSLSADEIKKLNPNEHKAYLHKLNDDELHRHHHAVRQQAKQVDKLKERKLQIISNILDSRPFYFSASLLSKSVSPDYLLKHLNSNQKSYIEERAKSEIYAKQN